VASRRARDLDLDDGAIANKRVFVQFGEEDGLPDDMTVDRDGRLWVAHFGGARVRAFAPNGDIDAVVHVPAPNVTTCAFGGADDDTLFVSTSRTWMTEAQLHESPLAGSLFACEGVASGIPAFAFDG
jgi:xylono-1,5-lactonase